MNRGTFFGAGDHHFDTDASVSVGIKYRVTVKATRGSGNGREESPRQDALPFQS